MAAGSSHLLCVRIGYLTPWTGEPFAAAVFGGDTRSGCFGFQGGVAGVVSGARTMHFPRLRARSAFLRALKTRPQE